MTELDEIIRLKDLPRYTGLKKNTIRKIIDAGEIEVFDLTEGGRAKGTFASYVAAYQQRRLEASRQRREEAKAEARPQPKPVRPKRRHLKREGE